MPKTASPKNSQTSQEIDLSDIIFLDAKYSKRDLELKDLLNSSGEIRKPAQKANLELAARAEIIVNSFIKNERPLAEIENLLQQASPNSRVLLAIKLDTSGHFGDHKFK